MAPSLPERLLNFPGVRQARLARLRYRAHTRGHPDWSGIVAAGGDRWRTAVVAAAGKRVLIATSVGLHFGASRFDSLLAVALTLRGARVDVLLCDSALPACMNADRSWYADLRRYAEQGPQADFCGMCFKPADAMWRSLGLAPLRISSFLDEGDREAGRAAAAAAMALAGTGRDPATENALAGALRFFGRSTLQDGPGPAGVLGAFAAAATLAERAAGRLFRKERYDVVVLHHGIYVPQGPILAAARNAEVRIVTWNPGYRSGCFVLSHDDTYHRTMITEPAARWEDLDLGPDAEATVMRYLESRRRGDNDWIVFNRATDFGGKSYLLRHGLDLARPTFLAATNVAWDAQLHYAANCFPTMGDWLVETVRWFAARPDLQLVVRVHPAEATGHLPSREPAAELLRRSFPDWPDNVLIVEPRDPISTYALVEACSAAIIYATKMGIEIAAMGKPVLVAGEAWIRGKGFSMDAADPDDYRRLLAALPGATIGAAEVERARRYAFHYFFRRMIPTRAMTPQRGWPPYRLGVRSLAELEPGADLGLDVMCGGILAATPFEYPAERLATVGGA